MTREVKEAIVAAANEVGRDGKGTGGMQGYMEFLAEEHPRTFGMLLLAVMRTQVTVERTEQPKEYETVEDVRRELEQHGITITMEDAHQLQFYKGPLVELEEDHPDRDDGGG
jgi:hypothetical protein